LKMSVYGRELATLTVVKSKWPKLPELDNFVKVRSDIVQVIAMELQVGRRTNSRTMRQMSLPTPKRGALPMPKAEIEISTPYIPERQPPGGRPGGTAGIQDSNEIPQPSK